MSFMIKSVYPIPKNRNLTVTNFFSKPTFNYANNRWTERQYSGM